MRVYQKFLITTALFLGLGSVAFAHPHVFVEANIDVVRDDKGRFTELRQVWRFDELFSATITVDYDEDGDNKLNEKEITKVMDIVKESIAEYDFYTAMRVSGKPLEFFEPDEIKAYFEDGRMIMLLAVEPEKPYDFSRGPLQISASDTSFYVAFDYETANIKIEGNSSGCSTKVVHPDFDKLYADDSLSLTENFFDDPNNAKGLGDEFYSWATIDCS